MSTKRLLILGAGRGQIGLYKAAKEMGITTIAGTMPGAHLPCVTLADEVCYMDIADPEEVTEKAGNLNLDGVATCCLDTGIAALGKTCDTLHLTGLSEQTAAMCNDKSKMKKAFMEYGVNTAKYFEISDEEELEEALLKIQLPVIIKATDLQGSRGIYISRTRDEARKGFHAAMALTKRSYCIVEEYIEGWEFGAQAFVCPGEIFFVMPHGDETFMSHTAVPVGHSVPLDCNESVTHQAEEVAKKAIRAMGLDNCAVNIDMILKDNKVYMIELTGRAGANCLPELVEIFYGIEYYKMIAAMAVGESPEEYWKKRGDLKSAGLARMIISPEKGGIIRKLSYEDLADPDVIDVTFFKKEGDEVRQFTDSNDCIGQLIVKGIDKAMCEKTERKVKSEIDIVIE